jgi:anti-anti-sigma factor
MKLSLLSTDKNLTRIQSKGNITQADLYTDTDFFQSLLGSDCYSRKVLLSMETTPYIDSAGVGWLVINHKRFVVAGGRLVVHSLAPMVHQILKLLQMSKILNLALDDAAAQAVALGDKK